MSLFELFLVAAGLSMDAFAVAICKGLSMSSMSWKKAVIIGLYFGAFQAMMPLFGYFIGAHFQYAILSYDHWIAFILLGMIGFNMIRESLSKDEEGCDDDVSPGSMIVLAIATSIDALAVGVTLAFLRIRITPAVSFIGVITFLLSIAGVKAGNVFGIKYKSKAEFFGGCMLILIGLEILFDHLMVMH